MPRYEYECPQCASRADAFRTIAERHDAPRCECGTLRTLAISAPSVCLFKPMWAHNLDSEPIWVTSKRQYKEEAAKRGKIVVDLL